MSVRPTDDEAAAANSYTSPVAPPDQAPVEPDVSPEDVEARRWLAEVYQGDRVAQLTPRAIITGMMIGGLMSVSNLYVGLKTGWGLGVTITACIIAFAVFRFLQIVIPAYRTRHFTILENNTMASAASAAGYMSSAGLVSAIPALTMATGITLRWWELVAWLGSLSILGVFMAVPLKRQFINIDKLPFPTGTATAETLKSMHSTGVEALQKARALLVGGIAGAVVAVWNKLLAEIPRVSALALPSEMPFWPQAISRSLPPQFNATRWLERYTIGLEGSLIMIGAGAIMGIRVGVSLLVGSVIFYGFIGEFLVANSITGPGYGRTGITSWSLWPATAMMVTGGLTAFALKWKTISRAFAGLTAGFGGRGRAVDPLAHVEVPGSWFIVGVGVAGTSCVILGHRLFGISIWMGVLAVVLTFFLAIVAARATGETDVTPIGAMGKITQLTYGVVAPSAIATNLMTANITAGAASHAADLLTDLKSGYLIGGKPRNQTIAQVFGVLAGALVCVPVYLLIVKPESLGSGQFPAPAAQVWRGVAEVLARGIEYLPRGALVAMVVGGLLGILLTLAEELVPKEHKKWVPSTTALGLAGVIPAWNSISMFLGAFIAWIVGMLSPRIGERYTVAVSSGLIAGESLLAVAVIISIEGWKLWNM